VGIVHGFGYINELLRVSRRQVGRQVLAFGFSTGRRWRQWNKSFFESFFSY
jgi:hypothetical protein